MSKQYTQLTEAERYHIYTMKKQDYSNNKIAQGMGRDRSSIGRELRRNVGKRGYRYQQANCMAMKRHAEKTKASKLTEELVKYITQKLTQRWSPEQISGRLKLDKGISLSPETIYQLIAKDKRQGGSLHQYLRHQGKPYKKRYGKADYRGCIPGRVDIDERPEVVNERSRVGDWEADLVIGKAHKGAIVTVAERCCRLYLAFPIVRKTAHLTTQAITTLLADFKEVVHTITYDNGREFNGHRDINDTLECDSYFAKPYHSWERGLNENFNGLLRQYFPKSMRLDKVSEQEVLSAVNEMNHRPRKCLGFKTPWEVFAELTQIDANFKTNVALMT